MNIAEGCEHKSCLEDRSLTEKKKKKNMKRTESILKPLQKSNLSIKEFYAGSFVLWNNCSFSQIISLGSVAPSNPYLCLQICCLEEVGTDSVHLPSILLHPALSLGVLQKHKTPTMSNHSHFRRTEFCSLCMVLRKAEVLLCWTLFSACPIQLSLEMFWESDELQFPGCRLMREGRICTQEIEEESVWNRPFL